jgi:membrane-bound lytic murein transglycosylase A
LELLWVDSAIDAFFLHIQGSGRVAMADGGVVRVGYSDTNGQPYRAIGRDLVESGEISSDRISMQTIRAWLAAHPNDAEAMMARNRSFVFFRILQGDGPIGAMGVALVPGRSLAVDRRFVPLGLPVWLDATDPLSPGTPLRRLMVAQDTGGAIRGPVRGDVFWGHGAKAAARAGRMKSRGRYFLLLPRRVAPGTS